MITEREVSIVRQTCIKAAADLVGDAVEFMEKSHRDAILRNRESLSGYVIGLAGDFENMINKDLCLMSQDGIKKAPNQKKITEDCVNLKILRGEGKGEKHSTWPYKKKLEELGLEWNPDYQGYTGQLTKQKLEELRNSDEILEVTLGKDDRQRQVKYTLRTIFTELLKVEEEK